MSSQQPSHQRLSNDYEEDGEDGEDLYYYHPESSHYQDGVYHPHEHEHHHHHQGYAVNGHPQPPQAYLAAMADHHSQMPHPGHYAQSPTSLEQYAMFPGPKRSATPGQNQATHPTQFGLPSASQNYQTYPSSGSNAPDQLPPGKKFLCSLCIAGFERRYDLKRHMHTHSDQKEFVCPKCEKGLARHDSLTRHLTVCKGPKP